MRKIVFEWNGFCCMCHYDVFSEEVEAMFRQPMELLGKGFAVIEREIHVGRIVCTHELAIKEGVSRAHLSRDGKTVILRASRDDLLETEMIACLLLQIFLVEGLKQGILPFHGSAVHDGGKNIILLGESGAGKTTAAFEVCIRRGGRLIGNDFIALKWRRGRLEIIWDDRTSKMSLRKDVLSPYLDGVYFKDRFWGSENRNYYDPKSLNIRIYEFKGFIDEILWIALSETGKNQIRVLDFQENMQRLYLNTMGLITGVHLKLYDHQGNWIGNCPHLLETERLKGIHTYLIKIIHKYGCKELRGDLPFILTALCSEKGLGR